MPKWLPFAMLIFAMLGFADAAYLTVTHYQGVSPVCTIVKGCDVVTGSVYAEVFGIPVALAGAVYYFIIAALLVAYFDRKQIGYLKLAAHTSILGLLASAWFVYVQLGILGELCLYCMGSATSSTLIFILGMIALKQMPTGTTPELHAAENGISPSS